MGEWVAFFCITLSKLHHSLWWEDLKLEALPAKALKSRISTDVRKVTNKKKLRKICAWKSPSSQGILVSKYYVPDSMQRRVVFRKLIIFSILP